jgi:hypothetical protein
VRRGLTPALQAAQAVALGEALVLAWPGRQQLSLLNPTARLVWEALAAGAAPGVVSRQLADRFGVPPARTRADVAALLRRWRQEARVGRAAPGRATLPVHLPRPASWRYEACVAPCGRPVRLRFGDRDLRSSALGLFGCHGVPDRLTGPAIELWKVEERVAVARDGELLELAPSAEEALGRAIQALVEASYPGIGWLAALHAGAVGAGQRAVLLAGASGSGKSVLAAGLVRAGLAYLSDDFVPIDEAGRAWPVPFAICLKRSAWKLLPDLGQRQPGWHRRWRPRPLYLDPTHLGAVAATEGLRVGRLVFPRYRPDATAGCHPLRPDEALARLLVARAWLRTERLGEALAWLERTPSYLLDYPTLADGVRATFQLLNLDLDGRAAAFTEKVHNSSNL